MPEIPDVQRYLEPNQPNPIIIEIVDEIVDEMSDSESEDFVRIGADSDSGSECSEEGFKMVGNLKEIESPKEVESPRKDSAVELMLPNAKSKQIVDDRICTTTFPSTVNEKNELPALPGSWPFLRPKEGANGGVSALKAPQQATFAPQKTFAEIAAQFKPTRSGITHLNQSSISNLAGNPSSSVFHHPAASPFVSSNSTTPPNTGKRGRGK